MKFSEYYHRLGFRALFSRDRSQIDREIVKDAQFALVIADKDALIADLRKQIESVNALREKEWEGFVDRELARMAYKPIHQPAPIINHAPVARKAITGASVVNQAVTDIGTFIAEQNAQETKKSGEYVEKMKEIAAK